MGSFNYAMNKLIFRDEFIPVKEEAVRIYSFMSLTSRKLIIYGVIPCFLVFTEIDAFFLVIFYSA